MSRKQELLNNFFSSLAKPPEPKSTKGEKLSKGFEEEYTKPTTKLVVETSKRTEFSAEEAEKKLSEFDFNTDFGPALGITREDRYKRAVKLGLSPPSEIGEIIERKLVSEKCYLDQNFQFL